MTATVAYSRFRGVANLAPTVDYVAFRGTSSGVPPRVNYSSFRGSTALSGTAPTVAAGPDLQLPCGAKARLSCSAVAAPGRTIASYQWRVITKSANAGAVTFSDPTAQNPWFRLIPTRQECFVRVGVTAIDDAGNSSSEAVQTVVGEQANLLVPTSSGWQPAAEVVASTLSGGWD